MRLQRGFSLIEVLIATALVAIAAMAAVAHVTRSAGHAEWARDKLFARQKALSILAELRGVVEGGAGAVAANLDAFDDGQSYSPSLSIAPDPDDPSSFINPVHPLSGNRIESGEWRWYRQIHVAPVSGESSGELRNVSVGVYRMRASDVMPGERMAEVSSIIRTVAEGSYSEQVFDVYLLALENVPGWWQSLGALQPTVDAAILDLGTRNPGLTFRTHWITKLGYGRDDEYAPYSSEQRDSTDATPWAYVYPGRLPPGQASEHYYTPARIGARLNLDGVGTAIFQGEFEEQEPYADGNGNGAYDSGEVFVDRNDNGRWDRGNPVPYALADQHNHCKRAPEALEQWAQRLDAGQDSEDAPTLRMLLDGMILKPERYRHAILLNLHGELLPMPPTRNVSDAAADPERRPGWRVVTHPERLRPKRVPGNDLASDAPAFRVHAFKTAFPAGHADVMTQEEPYLDSNRNGTYDDGETFQDWNGNGERDEGEPITLVLRGSQFAGAIRMGTSDFAGNPNGAASPTLIVERLSGGVDADGDGSPDAYRAFARAAHYPEIFGDFNGNGLRESAEVWLDLNGDGARDGTEPYREIDGNARFTASSEPLVDGNGNGRFDPARPAEPFTDTNGNGAWDAAEPYWDRNGNGLRDGPTNPTPPAWQPWDPALHGDNAATSAYVYNYGEPFLDLDGDAMWDAAEAFFDGNGNGVCDGGFARGEMWFRTRYDSFSRQTLVHLYGTPLEAPEVDGRGLAESCRLYDLEYVPCPTPDTTGPGGNRFERDLAFVGAVPKNTARWRITLPLAALRRAFAPVPGGTDGDRQDLLVSCETRLGSALDTGVLWPLRKSPQNLSVSHAWFYDSLEGIPHSELYQMRGDPRHMPYADLDRYGDTVAHGYNWHFDNLRSGDGDYGDWWRAFEPSRLRDGWRNVIDDDAPRMLQWLRTALFASEAFYNNVSGFSMFQLSVGGDVGFDERHGFPSGLPMDGAPFGLADDVFENTLQFAPGSPEVRGSRKLVRSNGGLDAPRRSGGDWWSKPWLGELFDDASYATQWKVSGNLRAGSGSQPDTFHLAGRGSMPLSQQPPGTRLLARRAELGPEGITSFFNIGTSASTFHHQSGGAQGTLVGEGFELAANYGYPVPGFVDVSRPFHLASATEGGVGSEWAYTSEFPRNTAELVARYFDHAAGTTGSGLVRLRDASGSRSAYVALHGLDPAVAKSGFVLRYALLSAVHGFFAAGRPGGMSRVPQLPRVRIVEPRPASVLKDPTTIAVTWSTAWARWDGRKYTDAYPDGFAEAESDLVYRLLYSTDGGKTWKNMRTHELAEAGVLDWVPGVGPDPARTLGDWRPGADETFLWATPAEDFPEGSYLVVVEAHRRDRGRHYARHEERIHVER